METLQVLFWSSLLLKSYLRQDRKGELQLFGKPRLFAFKNIVEAVPKILREEMNILLILFLIF
jgi:hypothetical protein